MRQSAVRCGEGVPRHASAIQESNTLNILGITADAGEKKPEEPVLIKNGVYTDKKTGKQFKLNSLGMAQWSDTPVLKEQFNSTVPGLIKYDPPVTAVYNLGIPEQLAEFNALQAKTFPVEGPHVVIYSERDEFYKGSFVKLVKYSYVWYLLPEPK